jgi:GMP synthase-like glutamine amidotransferase
MVKRSATRNRNRSGGTVQSGGGPAKEDSLLDERKPVLVLQHLNADGPAFLGQWLDRCGRAWTVRNNEAGQLFPSSIAGYSALAILGGEMSANDEMPSLRQAERLILEAIDAGIPTLGHCLGGQLMARALGARVVDSPSPEIGWQTLTVHETAAAQGWLGPAGTRTVFQWHYEAFELPSGAEWLASSPGCPHQAFAIGPHLAMQFHIEVDADKPHRWSLEQGPRYGAALRSSSGSVQDGEQIRAGIVRQLAAHQVLADRIYRRWLGSSDG